MFVYKNSNFIVPVKVWLDREAYYADGEMVKQVEHLAQLPFVFHHVVLTPDGHAGYGMPIGGVIGTRGVIIPDAVGVDIGCGMLAVKTDLTEVATENLKSILGLIRERVPVGFEHHSTPVISKESMPQDESENPKSPRGYPVVSKELQSAQYQVGTLGGGNHFIEIQKGSDGFIWFMVHSGSRNLGKKVCDYHNKIAKILNAKWYSGIDPSWDLAFLPVESDEGQCYLREMNYCLEFAQLNRDTMAGLIRESFADILTDVSFEEPINIHHNYASIENHFKENIWVHRKGATRARKGELGIIPGSQGTKSYIVRGLGNPDSFMSCSHGAGRVMGRKEAIRSLDLEAEVKALNEQGILHSIRGQDDLEEAPSAYKNIATVIADQADLIETVVELSPLAVVKG
jgi:tRNA-splicing ligase RtcB